jgi:hypothetical protein
MPSEEIMLPATQLATLDRERNDAEPTAVFGLDPKTGTYQRQFYGARVLATNEHVVEGQDLPRLNADSCREISAATRVSDVVEELARLSDPSCVPRMARPIVSDDGLLPAEAFLASLIDHQFSVQTILDMSPMQEDATLKCLAKLVTSRIVVLDDAPPPPPTP